MSLKRLQGCSALPPHLIESLRHANIAESETEVIQTKLQERTSSQIVSYLQLALIKLKQTSVAAHQFAAQMQAQEERSTFGAVLKQHVQGLQLK